MGSIGGNVTLQWDINKENDTDQLLVANLILIGGTSLRTLYTLDPGTKKPLPVVAEKMYGNRITAGINDAKLIYYHCKSWIIAMQVFLS